MTRHRFVPRYRGVAWTAVGVGGSLATVGVIAAMASLPLATGVFGVVAGAAYLLSPTWRMTAVVDDEQLVVERGTRRLFELPWREVVRVIAAPSSRTCFVDGGAAERNFLVPGDGAPAPYDLTDREALYDAILARVPADRVQIVDSLEDVMRPEPRARKKES